MFVTEPKSKNTLQYFNLILPYLNLIYLLSWYVSCECKGLSIMFLSLYRKCVNHFVDSACMQKVINGDAKLF